MSSPVEELKQEIVTAAARIVASGILTKSNHGNMSVRVPGTETFLLTAVSNLNAITADGIALFDFQNNLLEGSVMPTSAEIVAMHSIVYQTRPDAGSALHTHSPFATAFAVASRPMPVAYEPLVRFGFGDGIPVANYGPRGSQESVDNIANVLRRPGPLRGLLLENHGVLTFGAGVEEAVGANMVMEESAEIIMYADALGGAKDIPAHMRVAAQQRMQSFASQGQRTAGKGQ